MAANFDSIVNVVTARVLVRRGACAAEGTHGHGRNEEKTTSSVRVVQEYGSLGFHPVYYSIPLPYTITCSTMLCQHELQCLLWLLGSGPFGAGLNGAIVAFVDRKSNLRTWVTVSA